MDQESPVVSDVSKNVPVNAGKGLKTKLKNLSLNFKSLSVGSKRLLSLGLIVAMLIALPLLVLTIISTKTAFLNRAATGETVEPPLTPTPTSIPTPTPSGTSGPTSTPTSTPTCYRNLHDVSFKPASQSGHPGSQLVYEVTITNHNSKACPSETFSLTTQTPSSDWKGLLSHANLTVGSESSGTAKASFISPITVKPAVYPVGVSIKGSIGTVSKTAAYQVVTSTPTPTPSPSPITKPVISTISIPSGRTNRFYSATISGYENATNVRLNMTITNLPKGLTKTCVINDSVGGSSTGINCYIKGTPLSWGLFRVYVRLTDNFGQVASKTFTLLVSPF